MSLSKTNHKCWIFPNHSTSSLKVSRKMMMVLAVVTCISVQRGTASASANSEEAELEGSLQFDGQMVHGGNPDDTFLDGLIWSSDDFNQHCDQDIPLPSLVDDIALDMSSADTAALNSDDHSGIKRNNQLSTAQNGFGTWVGVSDSRSIEGNLSGNVDSNFPVHPSQLTTHSTLNSMTDQNNVRVGLMNTGNSCYQNSVLQLLHLTHDYQIEFTLNHESRNPVTKAIGNIFNDLSKDPKSVGGVSDKTKELKSALSVSDSSFKSNGQHDAQEFLNWVLELSNAEEMKDMFTVTTEKQWDLPMGDASVPYESPKETHQMLSLPVHSDSKDVQSLIDLYQSTELILGFQHPWLEGVKVDAPRRDVIIESSKYLIIQLKRFNSNGMITNKMNDYVPINQELQIAGKQYILYGTVIHTGESGVNGHYTALARRTSDALALNDHQWWNLNDNRVRKANLSGSKQIDSPMVSSRQFRSTPYILFYVRSDQVVPSLPLNPMFGYSDEIDVNSVVDWNPISPSISGSRQSPRFWKSSHEHRKRKAIDHTKPATMDQRRTKRPRRCTTEA